MYQGIINRYGKHLVIAGMILAIYISYIFSFKHTFDAISLNKQLSNESSDGELLTVSHPQLENQHRFYLNALKPYHVKKEDWENRLWQSLSGIAVNKGVNISFVPSVQGAIDTIAIQKGMIAQQFTLKGQYFNIIKLLDSVAKTSKIGRIAEFTLIAENEKGTEAPSTQLTMRFSVVALAR